MMGPSMMPAAMHGVGMVNGLSYGMPVYSYGVPVYNGVHESIPPMQPYDALVPFYDARIPQQARRVKRLNRQIASASAQMPSYNTAYAQAVPPMPYGESFLLPQSLAP